MWVLQLLAGQSAEPPSRRAAEPSKPAAESPSRRAAEPSSRRVEPPSRRAVSQIALERRLAERLNARVGDTVSLRANPGGPERVAVIAAVYEPFADPSAVTKREYHVRLHLPELAGLLGTPDRVDRIGVALEDGQDPVHAAERLNRVAFGFRAHPATTVANASSQTFRVVSRFHQAIAVISVMASAIFLLCIMLLKVEERRRDTAVMGFIGIGRGTIFSALLLEALLVAAIGSAVGVLLALGASVVTNLYYQRYFDTTLVFSVVTPAIIRFSVLLSLALGLVAGAVAAGRLVRTKPMVLWGRG
jgi:putative ABC transport system permease protein